MLGLEALVNDTVERFHDAYFARSEWDWLACSDTHGEATDRLVSRWARMSYRRGRLADTVRKLKARVIVNEVFADLGMPV